MIFRRDFSSNLYNYSYDKTSMENPLSNNWKIAANVYDYLKKCDDSRKPVLKISDLEEIKRLEAHRENLKIAQKNGLDVKRQLKAVSSQIHKIRKGGLN